MFIKRINREYRERARRTIGSLYWMNLRSPSWTPDEEIIDKAVARSRGIVASPHASKDLRAYYSVESNYAGATFLSLGQNDPKIIGFDDLLAVTTLSVRVPVAAIRRFVGESEGDEIDVLLAKVDPGLRLEDVADTEVTDEMAAFYEAVKTALRRSGSSTSGAWVTASKICARKRPHLFPVRDSVLRDVLGLQGDYNADWPVFAAVVRDAEVHSHLERLVREVASEEGVDVGDPTHLLRHLDVVLWMHGVRQRRAS